MTGVTGGVEESDMNVERCPQVNTKWNRRHFILSAAGGALVGLYAAPGLAAGKGRAHTIVVVGDSMSAEYGIQRGSGWVALLQQRLQEQKVNAKVVNASVSGDTTAGGRARLPALLTQHQPTVVVIELGGNDALRGLPLKNTEDNLATMVQAAQKAGAQVLLVGMQVPPNYGGDYTRRFAQTFVTVSQQYKTALVPFLLEGVANAPDAMRWFQTDRIHPNEQAHPRMLDNVWPTLKGLLR